MSARRLTVCAASALVPILVCASSAWGVYVKDLREPSDLEAGMHERVGFSQEMGGLVLHKAIHCVPFVWVPSPDTGIVSKLDARTGREIARYRLGPDGEGWAPTAIAADNEGNVYVACRCYGATGKVVRIAAVGGVDRNGDGIVATCADGDMNGRITPSETLAWGTDERVGEPIEVGPEDSIPVSLAFDGSGYLWVALWGERAVAKVDIVSRGVIARVSVVGRPSSLAVDQRGSLWVLSRDNSILCQVSTVTNTLVGFQRLPESSPGGMCVDESGKLWIGNALGGLIGFQTATGVWSRHQTDDLAGCSGVTVDRFGDVWAACPTSNRIAHFSGEDGSFLGYVPAGVRPECVCVDEDGYVWSLDDGSATATRIDTENGTRVLTTSTVESPFSSSPFASCVLRRGVAPDGVWRIVLDSGIKGAGWGLVSWQCVGNSGRVDVKVRTAETPEELPEQPLREVSNGQRFVSQDGRYIEVVVRLISQGGVSPVLRGLHVEGVNRAPDVSAAVPSISRLTALDHGLEPVEITGIRDPEGDAFTVTVTGVTQDEPVWGLGEDDKWPDATGVGTSSVSLRREMDPGVVGAPGNGRVYTIFFKATDSQGAASAGKVKVMVPVGVLPTDQAKDDGPDYDSTSTPPKEGVERA